jgi:purine-nucleoside phosphorylase
VNRVRFMDHDLAAIADFGLVERAVAAARARNVPVRVGNVFSSDFFYPPDGKVFDLLEKLGILGVEMEAAGLYGMAAEYGVRALTILTVSDHIRRGEHMPADARRTSFDAMIQVALDAAVAEVG